MYSISVVRYVEEYYHSKHYEKKKSYWFIIKTLCQHKYFMINEQLGIVGGEPNNI